MTSRNTNYANGLNVLDVDCIHQQGGLVPDRARLRAIVRNETHCAAKVVGSALLSQSPVESRFLPPSKKQKAESHRRKGFSSPAA